MREFFIGLSRETIFSVYQITENGVYMCTGAVKVSINEHLRKYNMTKRVTFNTETPYLHNCYPENQV